ncbi:hypothetical protein RUND412_007872 [Rhizina undulata]
MSGTPDDPSSTTLYPSKETTPSISEKPYAEGTPPRPITYRYLEWSTAPSELHPFPEQLPHEITKFTDPFTWSRTQKNSILALCCFLTNMAAYAAGAYTSGIAQMEQEWGVSRIALLVGVTTFTVGFAIAPMALAPLSEVYGRRNVFLWTYLLFNVCILASALCRSYAGMLVARFFLGVGGSTFSTMVGGVIADIYHSSERGFPMSLFSTVALFGTGLGPLVSGFIGENMSWRWIHWIQLIINGVGMAVGYVIFKETRGTVLLSRKARALNKWLDGVEGEKLEGEGKVRWKVRADEERATLAILVKVSLTKPFFFLFTEPVVFWFSFWAAFSWGILYLFLQGVPLEFSENHHFTASQEGMVFISMCAGSIVALILNLLVEFLIAKFITIPSNVPEARLYSACVTGCCLPIGMFWFGWTSFSSMPWISPVIAVGCATVGIYATYLAVFNYLADTYHRYASSALAAQSFCRNMLAGAFPLITNAMFHKMGFPGASSFLGGVGALLSIVPWVLVYYGTQIRARSKFAKTWVFVSAGWL